MMSSPLAVARSVSPDGALPAGAEHGLTHLHKQSSSSNLSPLACASPPGSPKSGAAATVCFHGASVPVTAEEAADLLAYLDREAVLGRSRAAVFLRRVAGRLLNDDLVRTSLDDAECFAEVNSVLASFRLAQRLTVPHATKPQSGPNGAEEALSRMSLDEAPPAPALPTPAAAPAPSHERAHSLLDASFVPYDGEAPATPQAEAEAALAGVSEAEVAPLTGGAPVSPLRRLSLELGERLSKTFSLNKRAGDEALDKLEKL